MKNAIYLSTLLLFFSCNNSDNEFNKNSSVERDNPDVHERTVKELTSEAELLMTDSAYEKAAVMYGKVLELEPDNIYALKFQANCYARSGDHQSALENLSKAMELDENNELLYLLSGDSYNTLGNLEEAILAYQKVIDLAPAENQHKVNAHFNIGSIYYNRWMKEGDEEDKIRGCEYIKKAADLGSEFAREMFSTYCNNQENGSD